MPKVKILTKAIHIDKCPFDKQSFEFELPIEIIEKAESFPVSCLIHHVTEPTPENPTPSPSPHYFVVFVDRQFRTRGIECVSVATPIQSTKTWESLPLTCPDGDGFTTFKGVLKKKDGAKYVLLED